MKSTSPRLLAHLARQAAGWSLIVLGVIGLFVPILQGVLFIAIGALLLAPYIRVFRRISVWIHRRFPWVRKHTKRFRNFKKPQNSEPPV